MDCCEKSKAALAQNPRIHPTLLRKKTVEMLQVPSTAQRVHRLRPVQGAAAA
jgi:hypothetical protein